MGSWRHATTHRTIRSHAALFPADRWDDDIVICVRCERGWPHSRCELVRTGVVAHYRQMVPPPESHGGHSDPRFAEWPDPPATELGRYCQAVIDGGLFP